MAPIQSNLRAIIYMVVATGMFLANDTLLKVALAEIPPFQALFMRSIASILWALPLLAATGNLKRIPMAFERPVMVRNGFELIAVVGYIIGLGGAAIADLTALSQLAPMIVLLGAAILFGDKITRQHIVLVAIAFAGALLVAQPGMAGFSAFALFGFWNAAASAGRDLAGRRVGHHVPGLVVAIGAAIAVLIGMGIATLIFERWVQPDPRHLLLIAGSGLFLTFGHLLIFLAFRMGQTSAVLPFYYVGTIWALLSGILVFGTWPNGLALVGIGLILLSGVAVVFIDRRVRPPVVV